MRVGILMRILRQEESLRPLKLNGNESQEQKKYWKYLGTVETPSKEKLLLFMKWPVVHPRLKLSNL